MQRHGGRLLVDSLLALGVHRCFGVPGESYLPVLDALHDTQGALDFIGCRNEGGASFMAAAWGKLTGSPGICFVTRGPGIANASIGIHTAMQDSSPMIVFVGQVATGFKGREAFQEIDYEAVFGTFAKWVVEIDDIHRLTELLARAWTRATSGRPGPVVVALPEGTLQAVTNLSPLRPTAPYCPPAPAASGMQQLSHHLGSAKRPLILYGGCNWKATGSHALQTFAEASDIPVVSVFRYQDQYDNHSPTFCGEAGVGMMPGVKALISKADVLLAINVRFGENSTEGYTLLEVPYARQILIHVHTAESELGKIYIPTLAIQSDPNLFAQALAEEPVSGDWADWRSGGRAAYLAGFELDELPSPVDMGQIMHYLQERLPADVILTNGAGNFTTWPNKFFRYGPRARLLAPQSGAMGYGLPAAIAAKIAEPARTVVCFAGDGDFQMTCQELATARQVGAEPIILILNNGIYGTIRAHQERRFPKRISGTTMSMNPDFVALAKAYGFHAERIDRTADFAAAFDRALLSANGAVLDLTISAEAVTPHMTLSQMREIALKEQELSDN